MLKLSCTATEAHTTPCLLLSDTASQQVTVVPLPSIAPGALGLVQLVCDKQTAEEAVIKVLPHVDPRSSFAVH